MDINMRRVIATIDGYEQKLDKLQKDMKTFGEALNDVRSMIAKLTEANVRGSVELCHHAHEDCPHMSRLVSGAYREHHAHEARPKLARCKKSAMKLSLSTQKLPDCKRHLHLRKRNSSPHDVNHKNSYRSNRTDTIRRSNMLRLKQNQPEKLIADY